MTRPTRYKENESSRDWIDEFCATRSVDEVRGAFLFNMGKYQRRYGKKDDHLQEALKIQDYANRLVEYERSLVKPIIHDLYSGGWTPEAIKQAAFPSELYPEATEARMDLVGQNGNTAEHYACTVCYGSGRITKAFGSETCNACFGAAAGRTNDLR